MSKLELRVCDLKTGDRGLQGFESEDDAMAWLKTRPRFTDVLGVATEGISPDTNAKLRAAMRPLDDEEKAAEKALEQAYVKARLDRDAAERRAAEERDRAHLDAMATADPNRIMEVRWRYDADMALVDKTDPREIPEEAKAAVLEWVRERDTWVEGRGQVVGEARVRVFPGPLPDGVSERVEGGTFVPVTAPAKPDA
jgi:hypothetical protein